MQKKGFPVQMADFMVQNIESLYCCLPHISDYLSEGVEVIKRDPNNGFFMKQFTFYLKLASALLERYPIKE